MAIFLLMVSLTTGYSQNRTLDSLEIALSNATEPLEQFELIDKILLNNAGFTATNVDSTSSLKLVEIAQKLKNDSLLAISYNWIGSYFSSSKGDNTTALEYYFKALPLAIKVNDKRRISSLYFDIAASYFDLQNDAAAHRSNLKGGENLPDELSPMYDFMLVQFQMNEAQYYLNVNQNDSALYYADELRKTNTRLKSTIMEYAALTSTAAVQARMGNNMLADELFISAISISELVERNQARMVFYRFYIPFLLSQNRVLEAKIQARALLDRGINSNNSQLKLLGAAFFRQIFGDENQIDSAYYYSRMEADINALIFSQNNKNKIQALAFKEQIRVSEERNKATVYRNQMKQYGLIMGLVIFLLLAVILFRNNKQKQKTNEVLSQTLSDLKSTQSQLIQSEKLASLGQLTAGIAHEIKNPLNFVNNFSDICMELMEELKGERLKVIGERDESVEEEIIDDVIQNLAKIHEHGTRADSIVKSMLQHSREGNGEMEPTTLNPLVKEYVNLCFHGMRASKNPINVDLIYELDESIGEVPLITEDFSRVIINLCNNAFDAMREKGEKSKENGEKYRPKLTIRTRLDGKIIQLDIEDNGPGIPEEIKDKILQPFFTTKKGTEGTGLGLSITNDIIKAHGGELIIKSTKEQGCLFSIQINITEKL